MINYNLEKWKLLLCEVDIIMTYQECLSTLNQKQIENFESITNLVLPQEYKEFCQVFGSGEFGFNMFFIEIPYRENILEEVRSNEIILDSCKYSYTWSIDIQELLDNAYLFGGGINCTSFIITYHRCFFPDPFRA